MNSKKENEIHGIYCDAANCVYNKNECKCTAESVAIGTKNACSTTETLCGTFTLSPNAE